MTSRITTLKLYMALWIEHFVCLKWVFPSRMFRQLLRVLVLWRRSFESSLPLFSCKSMASTSRGGAFPYRSSEGLSMRQVSSTSEIQLRIDPMHGDLDQEITGLLNHVQGLKNVTILS